jgi:hypothetical protein
VNTKPCSPSPFGSAKVNSLDRGINGIFGIWTQQPESGNGISQPCPSGEKPIGGCNLF